MHPSWRGGSSWFTARRTRPKENAHVSLNSAERGKHDSPGRTSQDGSGYWLVKRPKPGRPTGSRHSGSCEHPGTPRRKPLHAGGQSVTERDVRSCAEPVQPHDAHGGSSAEPPRHPRSLPRQNRSHLARSSSSALPGARPRSPSHRLRRHR